jgi:hypothetical protein
MRCMLEAVLLQSRPTTEIRHPADRSAPPASNREPRGGKSTNPSIKFCDLRVKRYSHHDRSCCARASFVSEACLSLKPVPRAERNKVIKSGSSIDGEGLDRRVRRCGRPELAQDHADNFRTLNAVTNVFGFFENLDRTILANVFQGLSGNMHIAHK